MRSIKGKIVSFDEATWWGEVCYDLTILKFHGTSCSSKPRVKDNVEIVFDSQGRVLALHKR